MKDNIPVIYWTFRVAWTILHFVVVGVAAAALTWWAVADDNAARAFEPAKDKVLGLQERVSSVIPWPWALNDDEDRNGSNTSYGSSSSSGTDGSSSTSEDPSNLASTQDFQVIGEVNVRRKPSVKSKKVDTLSDSTWISVDCVTDGSVVDPGPYKTQLSQYAGRNNGPTSLWVHIPGKGYVSDAYVTTEAGSGLPQC